MSGIRATRPQQQAAGAVARSRRTSGAAGRLIITALAVAALLAAGTLAVASVLTDYSYWARIIAWREASFYDFKTKFPAREIPNAPPLFPLGAAPAEPPAPLTSIAYPTGEAGTLSAPLEEFVAKTGTTAFLVLKDDALLVERYANGSSHESIQTSFSVAKSFDSTLVGIAISEGLIGSVEDPIMRYLPELEGRGLDRVRLRDLLNMSSGLRYDGAGSGGTPWQDDARTYYDPDLRQLALTVQPAGLPGRQWQYNNYHPLLIGLVLERTTGRSVSAYLSDKLWGQLGMEAPASWSLDSQHDGFEKMESGINARAVDFARFGRLFLRDGIWQGRHIVPRAWAEAATHPVPGSPVDNYGYFWWIDTERPGRFYAWGNLGQYIYV
ncbi:MAG: beta-lactamase family protein, partial [Chloroflexota bacterium]|nr:beta-lactamase family protein [Chloroflexota bacterium]